MTQRVLGGAFEERERFEQLLKKYDSYRKTYNYIFTMSRDCEVAQDIVQEAVIRAWRNFGTLQNVEHFPQWISKIASNAYKDHCDKEARLTSQSYYENILLSQQDTTREADPVKKLFCLLSQETLQLALRAIPVKQRHTILLYAAEDMSYEEIAELCSCPVGTVKSRIHDGRRSLSSIYNELMAGGLPPELRQTASATQNRAVKNRARTAPEL